MERFRLVIAGRGVNIQCILRGHGGISEGLGTFRYMRILVLVERAGAALRQPAKHESQGADGCLAHETSQEMERESANTALAAGLATSII